MTSTTEVNRAQSRYANPIFLVGVFRSGTSLLYSLLNQHSEISLMYETDIWDFPRPFSNLRFRGNWLERQEFYNRALSRHRLTFGGQLRGLEDVRTPADLYQVFSKGKQAVLWGEKSPVYCGRLHLLANQYPNCSIILLWRDPLEVYRSVVLAGQRSRFFRRRGMLSRIIRYHEQMIEQATTLKRAGVRVHHVTYGALIDQPAETCESICEFLGVKYDGKMLELSHADFSAVYRAPQHEHLRRGVIERRQLSDKLVTPAELRKLERFRARWHRAKPDWFPVQTNDSNLVAEPSSMEQLYHQIAGSLLWGWDNFKRALFEFLPLPWLRTYRQTANWLFAREPNAFVPRHSVVEEFRTHRVTVLACAAMMFAIGFLHTVSDPRMTYLPLYLLPCTLLTLVVGLRWGTFAAIVSAFLGPIMQSRADPHFAYFGLTLWNSSMRLALFEAVVLLVNRVRIEVTSPNRGDLEAHAQSVIMGPVSEASVVAARPVAPKASFGASTVLPP